MFAVHIDTAETWRGSQNQALLTAVGEAARGHRGTLVAHPDGDLRRHMSRHLVDLPVAEVMTPTPRTIALETLASEALEMLNSLKITSLFVIDEVGRPVGLVHIHDPAGLQVDDVHAHRVGLERFHKAFLGLLALGDIVEGGHRAAGPAIGVEQGHRPTQQDAGPLAGMFDAQFEIHLGFAGPGSHLHGQFIGRKFTPL